MRQAIDHLVGRGMKMKAALQWASKNPRVIVDGWEHFLQKTRRKCQKDPRTDEDAYLLSLATGAVDDPLAYQLVANEQGRYHVGKPAEIERARKSAAKRNEIENYEWFQRWSRKWDEVPQADWDEVFTALEVQEDMALFVRRLELDDAHGPTKRMLFRYLEKLWWAHLGTVEVSMKNRDRLNLRAKLARGLGKDPSRFQILEEVERLLVENGTVVRWWKKGAEGRDQRSEDRKEKSHV